VEFYFQAQKLFAKLPAKINIVRHPDIQEDLTDLPWFLLLAGGSVTFVIVFNVHSPLAPYIRAEYYLIL
jgi:hypothetical protein